MDSFSVDTGTIFGILGTLFGFFCLLIALRSYAFSQRVAKAQKVFETADLDLSLFGDLSSRSITIALPFNKGRVFVFPLVLSLKNRGLKSVSDLELIIRLPRNLSLNSRESVMALKKTAESIKETRVSEHLSDNFYTCSFYIDSLNPKQSLDLEFPLLLDSPSSIQGKGNAVTADNVSVTFSFRVELAAKIDCVLFVKDARPLLLPFTLSVLEGGREELRASFEDENERRRSELRRMGLLNHDA